MRFQDRVEAGQLLAKALEAYKSSDVVVYALPRGGVVLGVEIAKRLHAPLDLIMPRKVGHPSNPEYAICAVTEDGSLVCNQREASALDPKWLETAVKKEQAEAKRRRLKYLASRPDISAKGKAAIIVDDGIATGLTMLAAINEVKNRYPAKIVIAIPVIPSDTAKQLGDQVDEIVALDVPRLYLGSVGAYYKQFDQVEDQEVIRLLADLDNAIIK